MDENSKFPELIELLNTSPNLKNISGDYIGEGLSIKNHLLQVADRAMDNGEPDYIVVACFLHDIGQLLGDDDTNGYGSKDHGQIGAHYVEHKLKISDQRILDGIRYHVDAKRYLVTIDQTYINKLSDASKETLKYQGGTMSKEELEKFRSIPNCEIAVKVRKYDDMGKQKNRSTRPLNYYLWLISKTTKFEF